MKDVTEYTADEMTVLNALTPKQRGFVLHYIEHGSPKHAYIANYSCDPNNPRIAQKAYERMMKNDKVSKAIEVMRRGLSKRNDVTVDSLVQELLAEVNDAREIRQTLLSLAKTGNLSDKLILRKIDKLTLIDRNRDTVGAIKQISQMLGFNMPKKVEQTNNLIQINIIKSTK